MNIDKLTLFFFVSLFLLGCKETKTDKKENDIDVYFTNPKKELAKGYCMSDYLDSVRYVTLETNNESLIGNVVKKHYINNKIYISDAKSIFIFDQNGKYLNSIKRHGRGHGEYLSLTSFDVNCRTGEISILDSNSRSILIYSDQCEFIRKIHFNDIVRDFAVFPNGHYLMYTPDYMKDNHRGVWEIDPNGNFYCQQMGMNKGIKMTMLHTDNFIHIDDNTIGLMGPVGYDTIYHFNSGNAYRAYNINIDKEIKKRTLKKEIIDFEKNYDELYTKGIYLESKNFLHFVVIEYNMRQLTVRLDKTTKKIFEHSVQLDGSDNEPDLVDYGEKVPLFITMTTMDNGVGIGCASARFVSANPDIQSLYPTATTDSNPLIALFYFK